MPSSARRPLAVSIIPLCLALLPASPALAYDGLDDASTYLGSREYREYKETLRGTSDAGLAYSLIAQIGSAELTCGSSGFLVALSAALDTLPVFGALPDVVTYTRTSGREGSGVGLLTGGALGAVIDLPAMALDYLADGRIEDGGFFENYSRPFDITRGAYRSTYDAAVDLFDGNSACVRHLDNVGAILAVQQSREEHRAARASRITSESEHIPGERSDTREGSSDDGDDASMTQTAI